MGTLTEERTTTKERTTETLPRRPLPPFEAKEERRLPRAEPPRRFVRFLPWTVAIVLVIALTSIIAIAIGTGDDTPANDLQVPQLAEIDPHESPEVLGDTSTAAVQVDELTLATGRGRMAGAEYWKQLQQAELTQVD